MSDRYVTIPDGKNAGRILYSGVKSRGDTAWTIAEMLDDIFLQTIHLEATEVRNDDFIRVIISGSLNYTSNGELISGNYSSLSGFSASKMDDGSTREYAYSYSIDPSITRNIYDPTISVHDIYTSINYFYSNYQLSEDFIDIVGTNPSTDRSSIDGKIHSEYGLDGWWNDPYKTFFTGDVAITSTSESSIFDLVTGMDDVSGVVFRLYNAAFARLPDADGLSNWINANESGGFSYEQTANEFVNSQESINRYGSNQGDTDYITTVYNNVLDRDPDSAGLSHYESLLGSGEMSRAEMMFAFSESPENRILFTEVTGIS